MPPCAGSRDPAGRSSRRRTGHVSCWPSSTSTRWWSSTRTPQSRCCDGSGRTSGRRVATTRAPTSPRRRCCASGAVRPSCFPTSTAAPPPGWWRTPQARHTTTESRYDKEHHMSLGTVLVTGGASGLGAAVAAAVADEGGTPVVLDRVPPDSGHEYVVVDLAHRREAEDAVREA